MKTKKTRKCQICKKKKATAWINKKQVCQNCYAKLKTRRNPFKTGWLDKYVNNG